MDFLGDGAQWEIAGRTLRFVEVRVQGHRLAGGWEREWAYPSSNLNAMQRGISHTFRKQACMCLLPGCPP